MHVGGHEGAGRVSLQVLLGGAVVVVFVELVALSGVDFVGAVVGANLRGVVVGVGHRNDGVGPDEDGQFPERSIVVVDDAAAFVHVAVEVVYPFTLGQVDAVAHVVAVLVDARFLIDGGYEEAGSEHELILCACAKRVVVGVVEEHGAYHGLAVDGRAGYAVGVGHELALELEVAAVDARGGFAQHFGVFGVASPSVHVELHGRKRFPLKFAHIDGHVFAAENAVDV